MLLTILLLVLLFFIYENIGLVMKIVISIIVLQMFVAATMSMVELFKKLNSGKHSIYQRAKSWVADAYHATMRFFFKKKIKVELVR